MFSRFGYRKGRVAALLTGPMDTGILHVAQAIVAEKKCPISTFSLIFGKS